MDPFSHCDAMQQTCAQWYFHKTGGKYRGGTYKGLDVTFGIENVSSKLNIIYDNNKSPQHVYPKYFYCGFDK